MLCLPCLIRRPRATFGQRLRAHRKARGLSREALLCSAGHAAQAVCGGILFALGATGVGPRGWHAVKRLRGAINPERRNLRVLSGGAAEPDLEKGDGVAIKGTGEEGPTRGAATRGEDRVYFLLALSRPPG